MKILVISPLFPPLSDSESFVAANFVQALSDSGVTPVVICSSNVRQPPQFDKSTCWESIKRFSHDIPNRSGVPGVVRGWRSLRYQSTSWTGWVHDVVRQAKELHRESPFDLVVSRSLPGHAHLAGYWSASALRLPWVATISDPWDFSQFVPTESLRKEWKPNLNWRIWWRRIVASADALTFPCERLRDYCLQDSRRRSGVFVVPHIGGVSQNLRDPGEFVVVHAGKLGMNELTGRSAVALLDGVEHLFRMRPAAKSITRLQFVGPEDKETRRQAATRGLADTVACTGWVSYEESLEHIAKAAVCVLVEADVPEGIFLPAKLCNYIAARKPVLAFSPQVGTIQDLAKDGGILRVNPNDSRRAAEALIELFDAFVESRLKFYAPPDSLVGRFDGKSVVQNFFSSLRSLGGDLPVSDPRLSFLRRPEAQD